jgi:hypothetical protein
MNKFGVLLSAVSLGLPALAAAYDGDAEFGDRNWYGGRRSVRNGMSSASVTPLYYRPTQRYYGNGCTVNYRYVPVYRADGPRSATVSGASNFRTEAFRLATEDAQSWGAHSPRVTVRDPKSAAPRTAVTAIVRKKTTGKIPSKASSEAAAPAIERRARPALRRRLLRTLRIIPEQRGFLRLEIWAKIHLVTPPAVWQLRAPFFQRTYGIRNFQNWR